MSDVLLLTGGLGHPPEASVPSLRSMFADHDLGLAVHGDVEAGLRDLDADRHALLAVNALRFTMDHPRYDDVRAEHAFWLSDAARASVESWHAEGRPVLVLHTGLICFDDWKGWSEIVGGRWDWDRSWHPSIDAVDVVFGEARFTLVDECYQDLDLDPTNHVVATSADGHPLAWERRDAGPVAVDLLGHDARSLDAPGHRRLLDRLVTRLLEDRP